MAVFRVQTFSESLGTPQTINIIVPQLCAPSECSVLYLLHGLLDDQDTWLQQTRLVDYAERYKLLVVMPSAQRSFYTNQIRGYRWRDWVETELPQQVNQWYGTHNCPELIAGLSMGGFGALKLGLAQPERFRAIGAFSPVLGLEDEDRKELWKNYENDIPLCFGRLEDIPGTSNDITHLTTQAFNSGETCPYVYLSCGDDDRLFVGAQRYEKLLSKLKANYDYTERKGGHTWPLWELDIQQFLQNLADKNILAKIDA